jgi:hypothetical protein
MAPYQTYWLAEDLARRKGDSEVERTPQDGPGTEAHTTMEVAAM